MSLRFRCLIGCAFFGKERNTEVLGCGMVFLFLFLHYLTMEPRAGSSAFLSQQFPIYAFLVDMGGGKQGGDSDNMTDRPWMGKTAEREGSPGG